MSDGNTHDKAGLLAGIGLTGAGAALGVPGLAIAGAGCALGTLLLSPDLDLPKSNARRRWGILGFLWTPYSKAIPHRSPLSHSLILGTGLRVLYLGIPAYFLIPGFAPWIMANLSLLIPFYLGLEVSTLIHLMLDGKI